MGTDYAASVADALIYADSMRSADLRHAVPLAVPDAFLYAEANGAKHVFTHSLEAGRLRALGLFEVHVSDEFGLDELMQSGLSRREIRAQLVLREVAIIGLKKAAVPEAFPVWLADLLRAGGVETSRTRTSSTTGAARRPRRSWPGCGVRSGRPRLRWTPAATCSAAPRSAATTCSSTATCSPSSGSRRR
jgi:hypothetical protein